METDMAEAVASADTLCTLVKDLQESQNAGLSSNPALKKAIVQQAKQLITIVQDPFDHLMDQVVSVRPSDPCNVQVLSDKLQAYVIGATLALLKLGAFEAVPVEGSITLAQLATECNASESLIGTLEFSNPLYHPD